MCVECVGSFSERQNLGKHYFLVLKISSIQMLCDLFAFSNSGPGFARVSLILNNTVFHAVHDFVPLVFLFLF